MKLSILFLLIIFAGYAQTVCCQQINWQQTKDWKLYDIRDDNAFSYPSDTLRNFNFVSPTADSVHQFLSELTVVPKEKTPVWMGYFVTSCLDSSGSFHKIDISMYGGFLYDETEKTYYELALGVKKEWLEFWNKAAERMDRK